MKLIKTQQAVGQVLCHDITQIIKGVTKDTVFRKGHVITSQDIPVLLSVGKEHIYIWENDDTMYHEEEAAEILREICQGINLHATPPKEGKINLISDIDGLLLIDKQKLKKINSYGDMMIASRHSGFAVKKGDLICGTRVIPLVIEKEKMHRAKAECAGDPIMNVIPFNKKRCGIITTGSEIYHGRIKDTFTPVIEEKLAEFGGEKAMHIIVDDDDKKVTETINHMLSSGMDMIICTGGMSVDPDDKTPLAIKNSSAKIITYGAPVLPGAMLLVAYAENQKPILGLPGCVMYAKRTIFDLILPRVMADVEIDIDYITSLGEGGLCLNCPDCTFPNCGFGK